MTKTEHYQLNQWDADDAVVRTDFNDDNSKIDAGLHACSELLTEQAQNIQTLSSNILKTATGTFIGDGTSNRVISLGFTPKFVLLSGPAAEVGTVACMSLVTPTFCYELSATESSTAGTAAIVTNGFRVSGYRHNISGTRNWYFVLY